MEQPQEQEECLSRHLWERYRTSPTSELRWELFEHYQSFAQSIAYHLYAMRPVKNVDSQEYVQAAYLALLESIDKYKSDDERFFTLYAGKRIRGTVIRQVSKTSEVLEQLLTRKRMVQERTRSLLSSEGATESLEFLADVTVQLAIGFLAEELSFFESPGKKVNIVGELYEANAGREVLDEIFENIDKLPPKMRDVMHLHYVEGVEFAEVASRMELSRSRVSQLHQQALKSLQEALKR